VRQACDPCHVRKVRCDGAKPCTNCLSTELTCTYLAVPKKKGPKGKRIKTACPKLTKLPYVLNQAPSAREPAPLNVEEILGVNTASISHSIHNASTPSDNPRPPVPQAEAEIVTEQGSFEFVRSSLVTNDLLRSCLDAFFTHKYPIMPILDHDQTYNNISKLKEDPRNYALLTALSAVIVQQPEILETIVPGQISTETISRPSSELLIKETIRVRQICDHIENPTLSTVQTSFFLFAALFCLGKDNSAYYYIRESITMLQLLRLHEDSTYTNILDAQYAVYCRRTFWLLFITERAYALQRHRPLTLQRTIKLPTVDPGPEATILSGFLDLVSLFQNFDDTFLSLWNLSETDSPASTQSLVQLQDILKFAIPNVSERTEIQQADLLVSQQWLKTMVWQLCVSKGLLSSASTNESMSFHYPITIARDVVLISRFLPPKAFEANGIGILEKVFDIGCSLADVLSLQPRFSNVSALEVGPIDYLMELVRILGTTPGGKKYLGLLASKADECLGVRVRASLSDSDASDQLIEEVEEVSEDDFGSPGDSGNLENSGYSGNSGNPGNPDVLEDFSDHEGNIYNPNHEVQFNAGALNPDNFGYQGASTNDLHSTSSTALPDISTGLFAHPITQTTLNRLYAEHNSAPNVAIHWSQHP
jgi:hypothetical protein